jgi:nitroreductase/dihydropteridine reductase
MNLIELLNWRYATKKMDSSRSVPSEKVERILEAARLAPTSSGLQPFEIIVVTSADLKARIQPVAYGQSQVVDCSHLLVFAAWDNYTAERINQVFDRTNAQRGATNPGLEAYRQRLLALYPSRSPAENFEHAARQAYIAMGVALVAAAAEGVDSTPMEGFDAAALDELLGLRSRGLRSVLVVPLGYRAANGDWLASLRKVRKSRAELVTEVK